MAGWDDSDLLVTFPDMFNNEFMANFNNVTGMNMIGRDVCCKKNYRLTYSEECFKTLDGTPIRTLYVSRIPTSAVWNDVQRAFCVFGEIKRLFLKTGTDRPFAFVTFLSPGSALKAFCHPCVSICNRKVSVKKADSWHQPVVNSDGTFDWDKQERRRMGMEDGEDGDDENEEEEEEEEDMEALQEPSCSVETKDSLEVLNDDCLTHVFSFLSYKQLIGCERVCKRWQAVAATLWRRVHTLNFSHPNWMFKDIPLNILTLECLLKRCNDNLKVLNLCDRKHELNCRSVDIISKYCKNLEELYVFKMSIGNRSLPHLAKYCTKLKKIAFHDCKHFSDNDLYKLFASLALTSVTITGAPGISGVALRSLSTPLEKLNLNDCRNLDSKLLFECLYRSSDTMKELSLNSCYAGMRGNDFNRIVEAVPNLEHLSLAQSNPRMSQSSILSIGNLAHLKYLDLSFNGKVCDNIITAIVEGCKELSCLNISGPKIRNNDIFPLTEAGLAKLGKLVKLTELNISYLNQTSDNCLINIATKSSCLKVLTCIGCPRLTDVGCTQAVSLCNNLELFDVSGNDNITNETVKTALDSIKLCTSRKPLELIIGGTSVIPEFLTIDDNRLIINEIDNCKMHMRPDFVDNLFFLPSDDDDFFSGELGLSFDIMLHECFMDDSDSEDDLEMEDDSLSDSELIVISY